MTVIHRSQNGLDITYPCSMCVQRFHSLDALAKHKGIVHAQQRSTGIDAAFCNRCNMTLPSPKSLEDHMINVHNIVMDKKTSATKGRGKRSSSASSSSKVNKDSLSSLSSSSSSLRLSGELHSKLSAGHDDKVMVSGKTKAGSDHIRKDEGSVRVKMPRLMASLEDGMISGALSRARASPRQLQEISAREFLTQLSCQAESLNLPLLPGLDTGHLENKLGDTGQNNFSNNISNNSHNNNSNNNTSKNHECVQCHLSFPSEEQLEAHASLHYLCVSTEYGCSSCAKNFTKPDELQKHLMDIHAHHLYRCSLCKDIFDSKVNIQVHFAIKHSDECKLYKCVSCDITFRSEMEWQVHVRVNHLHMSKPYRCLFCQESFTSEVELQCHLTSHSKQFTCPMCDQAFHIEYLLDQHLQSCHSDFKMDICQSTSPVRSATPSKSPRLTIKQEKDDSLGFLQPASTAASSSSSSFSSSSSSSSSPRIILKSPSAPSPLHKPQQVTVSPSQPGSSSVLSPRTQAHLSSTGSGIWKNKEPLHVCNICDLKFCELPLLETHKSEEHGVRAALKSAVEQSGTKSEIGDLKTSRQEKLLLNNQTLLSALTSPILAAHTVNNIFTTTTNSSNNRGSFGNTSAASSASPGSATMSPPPPQLSCMFCSQTFRTSQEYNKHMKIHVNSGNLTCSICDETFPSTSVLAEHKLTHCKIHQGNTCVVCKVNLSNQEQFYLHTQEHGFEGSSLLQCVVCRQSLSSLVELQMHGRHHFASKPSFFTCCVCLKSFESKENLVSKLNASGRTYYVCKPCYHGEAPLHTCAQCSEKFATAQLLEAHMLTHKTNFQCIKCQQSFNSEYEIQLHVATHMLTEGTQHECRLCGALFDSPARLQTHLIQHSFSGRDILCFVCNKTFESPQEIQVHALEHSSAFKKHGCTQCSQRFFFSAEYENHKLIYGHDLETTAPTTQHTSPLLASALFSSPTALSMASLASFLSTSQLAKSPELQFPFPFNSGGGKHDLSKVLDLASEYHSTNGKNIIGQGGGGDGNKSRRTQSRTSSGSGRTERGSLSVSPGGHHAGSLECPECCKQFTTGTALANHRKTHFKKESSNTVKCSLCPLTFSTARFMQQHFFSTHSSLEDPTNKKKKQFQCMVCDKECSTLSALQNHILTHRTGSTLSCEVCKKTFTSQRYLNLHMRVHEQIDTNKSEPGGVEGSSPAASILCPICETGFESTEQVEDHLKTHEEVYTAMDSNGELTDMAEMTEEDTAMSQLNRPSCQDIPGPSDDNLC